MERGPGSELSSYWARQTAAWPRGGVRGGGGGGGAYPFLPHTPHHPTPQCHFTSDLIHSPHPSFMFTLTSFPRCHPSSVEGGVPSWQTQRSSKRSFVFPISLSFSVAFSLPSACNLPLLTSRMCTSVALFALDISI